MDDGERYLCIIILALPEREEDDGLDGEELEDWVVGAQQLARRLVEHEEGVQRQTDADVVDDRDVQVTTVFAENKSTTWVDYFIFKEF